MFSDKKFKWDSLTFANHVKIFSIQQCCWRIFYFPPQTSNLVNECIHSNESIVLADDCGDHVIVINSYDVALPGDEWTKRVYFHHTGYPGGASWTLAWELHKKDPTLVKLSLLLSNSRIYSQIISYLDYEKGRVQDFGQMPPEREPHGEAAHISRQQSAT